MTFEELCEPTRKKGYVLAYDVIKPKPIDAYKPTSTTDRGSIHFTSFQLFPDGRGKEWYLKSGFLRPHPLFDEIQNYTYVYELTDHNGNKYKLEIPRAEMLKLPFLGRFLQFAQYMYYVYGIKLYITDTVRSLEGQEGLSGFTKNISVSPHNFGVAIDINMIVKGPLKVEKDKKVVEITQEMTITGSLYSFHFLWLLLQVEQNSFGFFSGYDFISIPLVYDKFSTIIRDLIKSRDLHFDVVHLQHNVTDSTFLYFPNPTTKEHEMVSFFATYINYLRTIIGDTLKLNLDKDMSTINNWLFQLLRYFTEYNIGNVNSYTLTSPTVSNETLKVVQQLKDTIDKKLKNNDSLLVNLKDNLIQRINSLYNVSNINVSLDTFKPYTLSSDNLSSRKKVQSLQEEIRTDYKLKSQFNEITEQYVKWDVQHIDTFVSTWGSPAPFLKQSYIDNLFLNSKDTSNIVSYKNQNVVTHTDAYKFTFDKTQFWNTWTDYSIKSVPPTVKTYSNNQYVSSSNTTSTSNTTTTSNTTSTSNSTTTSNSTSTFVQDTTITINISTNASTKWTSINTNFTSINTFTRLVSSIDKT